MAIFGFGKKNEEKRTSCCCGAGEGNEAPVCSTGKIHSIKVLGAGCKTCHQQYGYAKEAAAALGLQVEVEYVTDMAKVMAYGVMSMPALVVNEQVVSAGRLLRPAEVEKLLKAVEG